MKKQSTFKMVLVALYIAIIFVLNSTPLGYIPTPTGINATTVFLPVIFAAITLGPWLGGLVGFIFGMTSFLQCFGIGAVVDPLAATLFNENAFLYAVMCFVPRILMGIGVGYIFKLLNRIDKTKIISYAFSSVSAVLLNTVLFLSAFNLFFSNTAFSGTTVKTILSAVITYNGIVELVIALVVGTAVSKALVAAMRRLK
ncbi:MAG: ECF transporter S component [Clostridia bacterium]|nr:ECF transporter S component [Clostridia bacterium]